MFSTDNPRFAGGSKLTAHHLDAMGQRLQALKGTRGGRGVHVSQSDAGQTISLDAIKPGILYGRLTMAPDTNAYSWREVQTDKANPGKFITVINGWTGTHNAYEINGNLTLYANGTDGLVVEMRYVLQKNDGTLMWYFQCSANARLQYVALAQDNGPGHTGNATTPASYTYTLTDIEGSPVLNAAGTAITGCAPTHNRPIGKTTAATCGTLAWKSDGTYKLYHTDEDLSPVKRSCP